jgi:hypothetical protein
VECGRAKLGCRVARGGIECELSAGWCGVQIGVRAERGALGSLGELWSVEAAHWVAWWD